VAPHLRLDGSYVKTPINTHKRIRLGSGTAIAQFCLTEKYWREPVKHFLIGLILTSMAATVEAGPVTLLWDANTEPDVTGYYVNIGTAPGVYTQKIDVGNVTSWSTSTIDLSVPRYFAVQAYNRSGIQSGVSAEVVLAAGAAITPDFGTDHKADLLWQHSDGWLSVWNMDRTKLVSSGLLNPGQVADPTWQIVATCDMNADGSTDIIWRHATIGWISVWFMRGAQLASSTLLNPSQVQDRGWRVVSCADFNRDGKPDLLWQHDSGALSAWLMNGTNLVSGVVLNPGSVPPNSWHIVGTADLNADGHTDIVWQHENGMLSAWLMNGTTLRSAALLTPSQVTPDWKIRAIADLNQDGRPDLVWRRDDGFLSVWYMNGTTMVSALLLDPSQVAGGSWQIVGPK
jgi:hypothetical protein